jgi:hypothetical protein
MELDSYVVTDDFFGRPFLDIDEERSEPLPHHYVHGGFDGTDTRFSCYFPPVEVYQHRLVQPIEGGLGGQESFHGTLIADIVAMGLQTAFGVGAYLIETNQGHVGPTPCAQTWTARCLDSLAASALAR